MDNVRLIDANATHDRLIKHAMECAAQGKLKEAADCVAAAGVLTDEALVPTIEAEIVRHGRWVNPHMNKYGHPCHDCSECHFVASQKDRNVCPNCGAKMDGKAVEA